MSTDIRRTQWYAALVNATIRHLQQRRVELLQQIDTTGSITSETRPNALALEAVDEALSTVGQFDTCPGKSRDPLSEATGER
ncbi:hypothetical protein HN911_02150 [Candidatus Bathyarchaeota archaeon]|jgi:hypothetical protein|nr:hypothetical protein [Candidatus Bathyarchaeota archaeon]